MLKFAANISTMFVEFGYLERYAADVPGYFLLRLGIEFHTF